VNPRSAALAGGALVAAVVAMSLFFLGDEPPSTGTLPTSSQQTQAPDPTSTDRRVTPTGTSPTPSTTSRATDLQPPTTTAGQTRQHQPGTGTSTGTSTSAPPRPRDPRQPGPAPAGSVEVTFRCKDDADAPLSGVYIDVRRGSGAPAGSAQSDAQGLARLEPLPTGESIQGVARHALSSETVSFGPITLRNGSIVDLKFRRAATGTLRGQIVDDQGQPVVDARLRLTDPKQSGEAMLDPIGMALRPDGTFQATVAAGTYAIAAEGPGYGLSDRTYATVPAGGEAGPVQLVLHRQGRVSGKVQLPPDLQAALPVSLDLVIEVTSGTPENPYQRVLRRPLEVDGSLRFDVGELDPGKYKLRLEVPAEGGNRVGPWYSLGLGPGQHIEGVGLVLTETAPSIRGRITDDQQVPLQGAQVSVRGRKSVTDRDGRFAVHGLDPGEDILVEASADRHAPATRQVVYEGGELQVDLVLPRFGGVRGVVNGNGGPASNVAVIICMQSDLGVRPNQVAADGNGAYFLDELPPGDYYIKAGPNADPFDATGAPRVQVRPGEVVEAPPVTIR
jgi:hypothetical protein